MCLNAKEEIKLFIKSDGIEPELIDIDLDKKHKNI